MATKSKANEDESIKRQKEKKESQKAIRDHLTENEQIELFAKLIIDIYLDNEYENEKLE